MDRRIERTKNSIVDAFLELRSGKDLEKISVKELCERAGINKSTFYTYYRDIYDLSEQLETQLADDILKEIGHPEYIFTRPETFTGELYCAYLSHSQLVKILFAGSREGMLIVRIEQSLKEAIYQVYPQMENNAAANTLFTLEIYGEYYAFIKCRRFGDEKVIETLCTHWRKTVELLRSPEYQYLELGLELSE